MHQPSTWMGKGQLLLAKGDIDQAFQYLKIVLEGDRDNVSALLGQLRNVRQKLDSEIQICNERYAELLAQCNALKKGREDSDEREEALCKLKSVEKNYNELKDEIKQYSDNDPAAFEAMRKAINVAYSAANRWTDNIFILRQWCSNNFPQAKEQLENLYTETGITEDFDYLELPVLGLLSTTTNSTVEGDIKA